jgi:uncharacterized protein YecT (DUF1311 family)
VRVWLVALAIVTGGAASAQAAETLRPPVIHEPFTLLPCPAHPHSTIALEGCAEHALLRSDHAIDARAKTIFGLLRTRSARVSFVQGEQAWLRYRRASCSAEASLYAGGTAEPVLFGSCELYRNRTHLGELAELERTLRTH